MEKELSFAKKINFEPLLISIFFGIILATIFYSIFPMYPLIGIVMGLLGFAFDSLLIYPKYLTKYYGYWKVDDHGIRYYDYGTWNKKVQAIFSPSSGRVVDVPYSSIKAFVVVDGQSIMNTQSSLGGALNKPLTRKIHYLIIQTNQRNVKLSFAWNSSGIPTTPTDIKNVVELINSKI
ncbi:hypothetical protein ACFQAV_02315 [Companilactobacillus huachuanensis]|uniref:Uncharacterized protein n=1 Tax=Companilactobacillus huachuanensis TaxID=2559914 RepID=A0ABW1RI39_9LACO|nr:hypothetical protein [Companilactobacillus huachuanensis]